MVAKRSTLLVLPTGTGKTVVFATVARDWPTGRVLIVAHREELIFQAAEKIEEICGDKPEIEMGEMRVGESGVWSQSHVVITTVQTMSRKRRQERFNPNDFGLVIIDEAHHAPAATYRKVIDYFGQNPECKILGVTATPDRADEAALGQVFDSVAFEYQIPDAINDGWLVPIEQQFVQVEGLDLSGVGTVAGDLNGGELARIMEEEKRLHGVVDPTIQLAGDKPTLVFAASVAHAERMAEIFNRHRGDSAVCIHGETPTEERRAHIERFKRGEFQFMCNMGIFLEGFDAPATAVIAMARPTKSRALYSQVIGRGTRPLPGCVDGLPGAEERRQSIAASGKPACLVLDFVGNSGRHKLVSTADILGGNETDEVIEAARAQAEKKSAKGERADMMEEIKAAREAVAEAERKRRESIVIKTRFRTNAVNPFDLFDVAPKREPGWHKGRVPTAGQLVTLRKMGVGEKEIDKLSFWDAHRLLDSLIERRKKGLCTYKQAYWLAKNGQRTDLTFKEASETLDRIFGKRPAMAAGGKRS